LSRDIKVTDGKEDQVGKARQGAKSGGAVFHNLDDPVDAFTDGVGEGYSTQNWPGSFST
jgi:hypothetical protein